MHNRKRVLFIGTEFYDYHIKIKNEIERQGYTVDFYGDRPNTTSLTRALLKINPSLMKGKIQNYHKQILEETSGIEYDYVFMLNGKAFSKDMISELKKLHNKAEFILYLWDSVELYPNVSEIIPLFDRRYTFDYGDASKLSALTLLPLFYSDEYAKISDEEKEIKYDLASICTAHPNRYKIIKNLFPMLEEKGIKVFSFYYIIKLQYIYNRLFVKEFRHARKDEFNFSFMKNQDVIKVISESRGVFDIPHDKQTGLTMRTIETIGAKKKLVTTNKLVRLYRFYNENNIYILESENYEGIPAFLESPYQEISSEVYESYSLRSWVSRILNKEYTVEYLR